MAWYYVKDNGTAAADEGRYATQQTGTFAELGTANYYDSIASATAATTPPAAGDFILCSDLHNFSTTASIDYVGIFTTPDFISSVDDANIDQPRTSGNRATETCTSLSNDVSFKNTIASGMEFVSNDRFEWAQGNSVLSDCKINFAINANLFISTTDACYLEMVNCELFFTGVSGGFDIIGTSEIVMKGGSVTTDSVGRNTLINAGASAGGAKGLFQGVDLSSITGTLVSGIGADPVVDDLIDFKFDMCKLAAGVTFVSETFKSYNQRALFTRCSFTSAEAEHQYFLRTFGGDVEDDSSIRRADDPAFEDSGTTISYKIVTNSDTNKGLPLWFDFPNNRWSELSTAGADTLRFHIASTDVLTDADIWVELSYPDGTNKQTPIYFSSAKKTVGGTIDLISTGTTLTTDSGSDWRDGGGALAGHNEYLIDVPTTDDVGSDTVPQVRIYVSKPSTTIYLGSIYDVN